MNRNASRFVENDKVFVFKDNLECVWLRTGTVLRLRIWVKRDVEFETISWIDDIVGLAAAAIQAHAVLTEELSHVANGKAPLEEMLEIPGVFAGPDRDVLNHGLSDNREKLRGQEYYRVIFAIL